MKPLVMTLFKTTALVITLGLALAGAAHAQWGWTDKDGRRIFSDQAPPADIVDKSIFKRPAGAKSVAKAAEPEATASAAAATASAPKPSASGPKLTGKDAELEKKKKEVEAAEAAKKKAEADKLAALRAENCERVKKSKANLSAGARIATANAKGEREFMSDADRATEIKRLDDLAVTECK